MSYGISTLKAYLSSYKGLPFWCWERIGIAFVNQAACGVSFFFSIYFSSQLHMGVTAACILISFFGLGTVIGGAISGNLSDKISQKGICFVSLLLNALAFLFIIFLRSFTFLAMDTFLLGLASYGFLTSNKVSVLRECGAEEDLKLKAINILAVARNLGYGVSAMFVSFLSPYGFKSIYLLSCILLSLSAFYLLFQAKPIVNKVNINLKQELEDENLSTIPSQMIIGLVFSCWFLMGLVLAQYSGIFPIYLNHNFPSLGLQAVSIVSALNALIIIFFQAPLINYIGKYNKIVTMGWGAIFLGGGMFILVFTFSYAIAIVSCVVATVGEMIFGSIAELLCFQSSSEDKKGKNMGFFQAIYAASIVIGPTLGAKIYEHYSGIAVWNLCGLLGVACAIICYLFHKNKLFFRRYADASS